MKITVDIGKGYALRSATGGLVTDAKTGKPLETLAPNKQIHMTAQEPEWNVPDDCAVTKVGFKYAPIAFGGGGTTSGEVGMPLGYTRVEYLKSTGTQYIDTLAYNVDAISVDYVSQGGTYFTMCLGYARSDSKRLWGVTGGTDLLLCVKGSGYIRSPEVSVSALTRRYVIYSVEMGNSCVIDGSVVQLPKSVESNGTRTFTGDLSVYLFAGNIGSGTPYGASKVTIYGCSLTDNTGATVRDFVPCVTPLGQPGMWDNVNGCAYINSGEGQFTVGLDMVSLALIVQNLPDAQPGASAELSVVLKGDESSLVWQAITEAVGAKGWTVRVVAWESVAAATTYGLRRTRQGVWCKSEQSEYGDYVDTNGDRFSVDRIMSIAGPLGTDPAEYGYEPFDSIEDAAAWFGLVPYVDPNTEPETLT